MTRTLLAAAALYAAIGAAQAETISGPARAIDGDTIEISGKHIRLAGIDAPEWEQDGGFGAAGAMQAIIEHQIVTCRYTSNDRYDRIVARCETPNVRDIGEMVVRYGLAVRYPRYDPAGLYIAAEAEAKRERRGLWQGQFEMPWVWRKEHKR